MLVPFAPGMLAPLCVLLGATGGSERPPEVLTQYILALLGAAVFCSAKMPLNDSRMSRAKPALRRAAWR